MKANPKPKKRIHCRNCKHYYITWDVRFPYGCKALNFKSHITPCLMVFESSGIPCQFHELKPETKKPPKKAS